MNFVSSPLDKTSSHLKKQKNPERVQRKHRTSELVLYLSPSKHSLSCPCLLKKVTGAGEGLCLEAKRF